MKLKKLNNELKQKEESLIDTITKQTSTSKIEISDTTKEIFIKN